MLRRALHLDTAARPLRRPVRHRRVGGAAHRRAPPARGARAARGGAPAPRHDPRARRNRTVLRRLRAPQTRSYLGEQELPQVLVDAVVAAEDRRFFEHSGIDVRGTRARGARRPARTRRTRGRLDDHAAARQERVRRPRALARAKVARGGPGRRAGDTLVEAPDPGRVPQLRLLRQRPLRDRRRDARLLRDPGGAPAPAPGGTARGAAALARGQQPGHVARCRTSRPHARARTRCTSSARSTARPRTRRSRRRCPRPRDHVARPPPIGRSPRSSATRSRRS